MALAIVMSIVVQNLSSSLLSEYMRSIKAQTQRMQELFRNTLAVIPNGVLIIDIRSKAISYANKEMDQILITINESKHRSLQSRICDFLLCDS